MCCHSVTKFKYSSDELKSLNCCSGVKLPSVVSHQIRGLDICSKPPTKRGFKGGKHKFYKIKRIVNNCSHLLPCRTIKQKAINSDNLVPVQLQSFHKDVSKIDILVLNTRSVRNKAIQLCDYITDEDLDIVALTETWLKENSDRDIIGDLVPEGYDFISVPRTTGSGGGVGLLFKSQLKIKACPKRIYQTFELLECKCNISNKQLNIFVVYRPPPSQKNGLKMRDFLEDFTNFCSEIAVFRGEVLIVGDLNVQLDCQNCPNTQELCKILQSYSLHQHVSVATHTKGHCLDAVISKSDSNLITNVSVCDPGISDHFAIMLKLHIIKLSPGVNKTVYRDLKSIDIGSFKTEITQLFESNLNYHNLSELSSHYNKNLKNLLDIHAPLKEKTFIIRPNTKWYNANLRQAKVFKRRLERKWRKSGTKDDWVLYRKQCSVVNFLLGKAKTEFYSCQIIKSEKDKKALFRTAKSILNMTSAPSLPSDDETETLPARFSNFFMDKIVKIRSAIYSESDVSAMHLAKEDLFPDLKNDH